MPAGPIGSVWAAGSWSATAWEANTWATNAVGGGGLGAGKRLPFLGAGCLLWWLLT